MQLLKIRVNEHYGDNLIPIEFPENWLINMVKSGCEGMAPMSDEEIRNSLDNTIGVDNISKQAKGKTGKIVVTCDDLMRPTPCDRVFPFIIDQLHNAGIHDNQIFVLGSFGTHQPITLDGYARKLGDWAVALYDCVNHNPFFNFEHLGWTSRGTNLMVNKEFALSDLRICISGIRKHMWSGASGGGKAVMPGVSSIQSILHNHTSIPSAPPEKRRNWYVKDNERRLDMQECARIADLNISINCVYNDSRKLISLHAGDVDDAWKEGVKKCYVAHSARPAKKSDIVIINAYPNAGQGIDWWGGRSSLREGGTAVAIQKFPPGNSLIHYELEMLGAPWKRLQGYPNKRWPINQAGNIIIFTDRLSKRSILGYSEKVEWMTDWNTILKRLMELHGNEASVAVYPVKHTFDSDEYPLVI